MHKPTPRISLLCEKLSTALPSSFQKRGFAMSSWLVRFALAFLSVLLGLQIVAFTITFSAHQMPPRPTALEVGAPFPYELANWGRLDQPISVLLEEDCSVGFVVDISCGACTALAKQFGALVLNAGPTPYWFVAGDTSEISMWLNQVQLNRDRVVYLRPKQTLPWKPPVVGAIWFTPTRVVLTHDLEVRDARPSDNIPVTGELRRLCREGGVAPQSLKEVRALRPIPKLGGGP